jgi:hypothetical protein
MPVESVILTKRSGNKKEKATSQHKDLFQTQLKISGLW